MVGKYMDARRIGILLILTAVIVMTAAQLLIKSRLTHHGVVPVSPGLFFEYAQTLLADWKVWVGGMGLVISAVLWYAALSRIPLSVAYPFAALAYPIIFAGAIVTLRENFSWIVLLGNLLIVAGVLLVVRAAQ